MTSALQLEKLNILVADDSAYTRRLIATMLRGFGIREIIEAEDGAEALEKITISEPDITIADWEMPLVDGADLMRAIRRPDQRYAFMPVIMISAYTTLPKLKVAIQLGVNDYICKPISPRELYGRIADIVLNPRPFVTGPRFFGPAPRDAQIVTFATDDAA